LRVHPVPVIFRRTDKPSTVRLLPDSLAQLAALYRFRRQVGMALTAKSPIYWSAGVYDRAMDVLCGPYDQSVLAGVARHIPAGASVVDVCCGTGRLASSLLGEKRCQYVGLDFNGHFVRTAQRRG